MVIHPIEPVYDTNSRILILGSFPSVRSREEMFFYGHPRNRFWRVLASVFDCPLPQTVEEKRSFLLAHQIALWDVIASCEVHASADSSIQNVIPNDLSGILSAARIDRIFVNGKTAYRYYKQYQQDITSCEAVCLPSTSPANAVWSLDDLIKAWSVVKQ